MMKKVVSRIINNATCANDVLPSEVDPTKTFIAIHLNNHFGLLNKTNRGYSFGCVSVSRQVDYPWNLTYFQDAHSAIRSALDEGASIYTFDTFPEMINWMDNITNHCGTSSHSSHSTISQDAPIRCSTSPCKLFLNNNLDDAPIRTIHPAYWPLDSIPKNWSVCDGRTENGIKTPTMNEYHTNLDGGMIRYVRIMKTGPKIYSYLNYTFKITDAQLLQLYGSQWKLHQMPSTESELIQVFPNQMFAAYASFAVSGHIFPNDEPTKIEVSRIFNEGYRVTLRRKYQVV